VFSSVCGASAANKAICCVPSSVTGDPHITGPNGVEFDVNGRRGGVYTLLASRHLTVNAQLDDLAAGRGPEVRYMTTIGFVIGNVSLALDTTLHDENYLIGLNKQLSVVGAQASFGSGGKNSFQTVINICARQRIVVSQMYTKPEWEPASFGLNQTFYYLDMEVDIAGCHDDFDGILGQLYQCRYLENKFVWDASTEESFRVATLSSTGGAFDADSMCYQEQEYGALFGDGESKSVMKLTK